MHEEQEKYLAGRLSAILVMYLRGKALRIVQKLEPTQSRNGFEMWRQLTKYYMKDDSTRSMVLLKRIMEFNFDGDTLDRMNQFDTLVR
jgi:hypothetical protein